MSAYRPIITTSGKTRYVCSVCATSHSTTGQAEKCCPWGSLGSAIASINAAKDGPTVSGSDGSSYYDITINGVTVSCNDVIDALALNFNRGEAFKALWRAGRKPGTSEKYDLDKAVYFTTREAGRVV